MNSLARLVGMNLKQIRKSKYMTQEELAEKCGLQTSFLAGVERGDRNITLQTLEKITLGLNVLPANIFGTFNIDKDYFEKEELISSFSNELSNKSIAEVQLIIKITSEIFNTYK